MNERIKELIEQAEDYAAEQHDFHTHFERTLRYEAFKEKFAELIVKECMNVLDPGGHQLIARFHTRQWLSEHFGVE
jgi:hypothetical protein